MKSLFGVRFVAIILVCGSLLSLQDPSREYQIKAAFLYNFTQFVEWPSTRFTSHNSPLIVGVLGKDPFGSTLDELMAGEIVDGHALLLRRYNSVEDAKNCHILFIKGDLPTQIQVLQKMRGRSILTVGEGTEFLKAGGMVRLYKKDDKVKIQINLSSVKSEKISISSKLLQLAEIISSN